MSMVIAPNYTDKIKENFPLFQTEEYDFFFENSEYPIGLKSSSPAELRKRVAIAMISFSLGERSMDKFYKKYSDHIKYADPNLDRLDIKIQKQIDAYYGSISDIVVNCSYISGKSACKQISEFTLLKLSYSNASLRYCMHRGVLTDGYSISRTMLEMLSWAYTIYEAGDEKAIFEIAAHQSITRLRKFLPVAGRFYGWLSDHVHWSPKTHLKSMTSNSAGKMGPLFASSNHKAELLMASLVLCHVAIMVVRDLFQSQAEQTLFGIRESEAFREGASDTIRELAGEIFACDPKSTNLMLHFEMLNTETVGYHG